VAMQEVLANAVSWEVRSGEEAPPPPQE
jgi:hypothetical protein